jgi:hypothetical protein
LFLAMTDLLLVSMLPMPLVQPQVRPFRSVLPVI